jgi:hypothetical protein
LHLLPLLVWQGMGQLVFRARKTLQISAISTNSTSIQSLLLILQMLLG